MSVLISRGNPCPKCNSSDAYAEYTDNYFCFSCKYSLPKKSKSSWAEKNIENTIDLDIIELPIANEMPDNVLAYLYKLHFTNDLIKKSRLQWTENCRIYSTRLKEYINMGSRLVIPYYENDKLIWWEAKTFDKTQKLKYITCGTKKLGYQILNSNIESSLVLVEDSLSAIRVGESNPVISLCGTNLSDDLFVKISKLGYTKFIVWLDSDDPGFAAALKMRKRLNLLGESIIVQTKKDPKAYSDNDIKRSLCDINF
jgi:hypothetical protein